MAQKIDNILAQVLREINPSDEELKFIDRSLNHFLSGLKKRISKLKIDVDVFVGGSYSKKTLTKGDFYDADLFLRFGKKYSQVDYSRISKKIFRFTKNISVVHGSRDYFRIKISPSVFFEVVPVKKIKKPSEAVNITDLSYLHVNYINKKIKNKKILDDIKLAKMFCKAAGVYGAESYIRGFSGYSLELLIYHFKNFKKFLTELSKKRNQKLVIDIESLYKKGNVLMDMNGSKLDSPVVLVDPTYKSRNVLAALSYETFEKFQESALVFLKKPSKEFFLSKKINFLAVKNSAKKKGYEFIKIKLKTKKQEGDIAGTKLLKFFNHLHKEFEKYFEIKDKNFEYFSGKSGEGYFVLKRRPEIEFDGPSASDKKNVFAFKKEHPKTFLKKGRVFAVEKIRFSPSEFLSLWIVKNKKKIREMSINGIYL